MKRVLTFLALLMSGALLIAACGGSGGSASGGSTGSTGSTGSSSGGAVTAGASGIKDATLVAKWTTADGASVYDFKADFSVIVTAVGEDKTVAYNIVSGGSGAGKVEVQEASGKVTWDYKITGDTLDLTTPEGRAKKLKKTS